MAVGRLAGGVRVLGWPQIHQASPYVEERGGGGRTMVQGAAPLDAANEGGGARRGSTDAVREGGGDI